MSFRCRDASITHARSKRHANGHAGCSLSGACVSQRDLHLIETLTDVDPDAARVEEAMVKRPFVVTGDTALDEVVEIMGEHKYGSVVVMGRQGVEGIFTAIDACQAFVQILRREAA